MMRTRVLMVCTGNICRSPMAQGMLEKLLREAALEDRVEVDSAGTHGYHVGRPPDPRAVEAAARRGIDIAAQRARTVRVPEDFEDYHYILAMDAHNLRWLHERCPPRLAGRIKRVLDFAPGLSRDEVPDPYYGDEDGFERALDLAELALGGLLDDIEERL